MSLKQQISDNYTNILVFLSTILLSFYVIITIIEEKSFFSLDTNILLTLLLFATYFIGFILYYSIIRFKINLNSKINQKLSISLKLTLFLFLFLPVSFLFLSEILGTINVGLIIFFIILDVTQYDHYLYLYMKENYQVFLRIVIFSSFMLIFVTTLNIIFFILSFSAFLDIFLKLIRLIVYSIGHIIANFFTIIRHIIRNLFVWILTLIINLLTLIYLITIHYLSYFLIIYEIMKVIWENKIKSLKLAYLIIYLTGLVFFLFFGPHDNIVIFVFLIMTVLFIIIFSKEIFNLIIWIYASISSFVKSFINLILHEKRKIFYALMWILAGTSFVFAYITFITGHIYTGITLAFMGIIFLHLAKIEVVKEFYKELVSELLKFFYRIKITIQILSKKLYYLIIHEFLYRFIQIINVLLLVFGFYLLFSVIFDPTGRLIKNLIGINIIGLFPHLNSIFEILFGFSLIVISVILYITTVQNKKKLVR